MSIFRIWTIAKNGFRETIRDRILYFIGFFAFLQIIALRLLPQIAATTENKMLVDFGISSIALIGVIIVVFVGTGLINKEIEKRTVLVLIPKPIDRAELVIGKHLGLCGVLAVTITSMMVIHLGLLSASNIGYPLGSLTIAAVFILLQLSLLTAVAILFGIFTSSTLATLMSIGIFMMGNASQELVKLGNLSKNAEVQNLTKIIYTVLPDFSRLNLINDAPYDTLPSTTELFGNAFYGILYTVVLLVISIVIFSEKEF
jgi:ABC-type transport system involved in multi-copper enzyme maturation permease subunit